MLVIEDDDVFAKNANKESQKKKIKDETTPVENVPINVASSFVAFCNKCKCKILEKFSKMKYKILKR